MQLTGDHMNMSAVSAHHQRRQLFSNYRYFLISLNDRDINSKSNRRALMLTAIRGERRALPETVLTISEVLRSPTKENW